MSLKKIFLLPTSQTQSKYGKGEKLDMGQNIKITVGGEKFDRGPRSPLALSLPATQPFDLVDVFAFML